MRYRIELDLSTTSESPKITISFFLYISTFTRKNRLLDGFDIEGERLQQCFDSHQHNFAHATKFKGHLGPATWIFCAPPCHGFELSTAHPDSKLLANEPQQRTPVRICKHQQMRKSSNSTFDIYWRAELWKVFWSKSDRLLDTLTYQGQWPTIPRQKTIILWKWMKQKIANKKDT